jgi:hypothetical protein
MIGVRRQAAAPRTTRRVLLLLAAATALLVAGGGTGQAHDGLVASAPAEAATVPTPPAAVELKFSGPPQTLGAQVRVTGPDGAVVSQGAAQVSGSTVRQPLASDLPAGEYTVDWRIVASDGHPLTGSFPFTAAQGTTAPAEAPSSDEATATEGAAAPAGDASRQPPAAQPEEPSVALPAGSPASTVWIALAAVVVLGMVGTFAFRRLRPRP